MSDGSLEARPSIAVITVVPVEGASPDDVFAGLPLALRTLLTVQKEGARRIVLVGPRATELARRFEGDARVRVSVEPVDASTAAEGLVRAREQLREPVLVAEHDVVLDPAVYRRLLAAPLGDGLAVVAMRGSERTGPLVAHPRLLGAVDDTSSLDAAITSALAKAEAAPLDIGDAWAFRVTNAEARRGAFHALFEACRKPVDGFVARHVNRHISIAISKQIVGVPVTPNTLSVFTFLLGVAGAVLCAQGSYKTMLAGAFLFQWNSILDGVDGELARVRFQHSKLGQWLDTVSDDASNLIFYAGVAIGARALPFGHALGVCAWVGIVASILATAQYYAELIAVGSGDLYAIQWGFDAAPPKGIAGLLIRFGRTVVKKDFAILFFLFLAALGVLPYALPVIALGAVGTLIAATVRNLRKRSPATT